MWELSLEGSTLSENVKSLAMLGYQASGGLRREPVNSRVGALPCLSGMQHTQGQW